MPALASIPGAGPSGGFEGEQAAEAAMRGVLQGGTLLQRPQLALQGLRADARAQLLAVALAAIQQHIQTLPAAAHRYALHTSCRSIVLLCLILGRCMVVLLCPYDSAIAWHDRQHACCFGNCSEDCGCHACVNVLES